MPSKSGSNLISVKMSMNPFCEIGLEEALRIKESGRASEVVAVSVGPSQCVDTLRTGLAMGVDRDIHVEYPGTLYPLSVAKILRALVNIEKPGLLFLGKQFKLKDFEDCENRIGVFVTCAMHLPIEISLTLITLAIVPLIAVAGGVYTTIMSSLSKKGEDAYAESGRVAQEVISQVRTVYSFVGEEKAIETYSNSLRNGLKPVKKIGIVKGIGIGSTFGLLFCCWALLLWYASVLVRNRVTNGGKAFTTILNVIYSGFALGQAASNLAAISKARAAVTGILKMIESDSTSSKSSDEGVVLSRIDGHIEFRNVCFAYLSRPTTVFKDLSFSVSAGNYLAIVGPSGSGKSTIISMIQRFYDPTSGIILLDGNDLEKLQLKWLRSHMGSVNQEPALFATTIAENILFGKEGANMEEINEAAKSANAHSFIQSLPNGYHSQVGEGGTQLSGGQKQRIAIARAILRNPKLLLMDEATSALDAESEFTVQQALKSKYYKY